MREGESCCQLSNWAFQVRTRRGTWPPDPAISSMACMLWVTRVCHVVTRADSSNPWRCPPNSAHRILRGNCSSSEGFWCACRDLPRGPREGRPRLMRALLALLMLAALPAATLASARPEIAQEGAAKHVDRRVRPLEGWPCMDGSMGWHFKCRPGWAKCRPSPKCHRT